MLLGAKEEPEPEDKMLQTIESNGADKNQSPDHAADLNQTVEPLVDSPQPVANLDV